MESTAIATAPSAAGHFSGGPVEEIIGAAEASALLTRQYRDPWGLNV